MRFSSKIVDSAPTIYTNATSLDIASNQSRSMTCSFRFTQYQNHYGGLLTPQISWAWALNSTLLPTQPVPVITSSSISSTLIVQATPPTLPAFTCTSSFSAPSPLSDSAPQVTNAPPWTYSATFPMETVSEPCEFRLDQFDIVYGQLLK